MQTWNRTECENKSKDNGGLNLFGNCGWHKAGSHQVHLTGLATSGRAVDPKLKGDPSVCCHSSPLAVSEKYFWFKILKLETLLYSRVEARWRILCLFYQPSHVLQKNMFDALLVFFSFLERFDILLVDFQLTLRKRLCIFFSSISLEFKRFYQLKIWHPSIGSMFGTINRQHFDICCSKSIPMLSNVDQFNMILT